MKSEQKYNPNIHHRRSIRLKGYDYSRAGLYFITICCQDRIHRFGYIENGEMRLNDVGRMVENEWLKLPERFPNIQLHEYVVMPNHFHAILEIVAATGIPPTPMGQPQGIAPTGISVRSTLVVDRGDVGRDGNVGGNGDIKTDIPPTPMGQPQGITPTGISVGSTLVVAPGDVGRDGNVGGNGDIKTGIPPTPTPMGQPQGIAPTRGITPADIPPTNTKKNKTVGDIVGAFKSIGTVEYIRGVKTMGWTPFNGKLWQRDDYEHIICTEKSYLNLSEYILHNPAKWTADTFNKK